MTSRALLIGCQLDPLRGIEHDLTLVQNRLDRRGFQEIRRVEGVEARRKEIIEAFADLVVQTVDGDAVVVYYSGHGGLALNTASGEAVQYLTTTDYPDSTADDFRGITDTEFAILIAALARVTPNVSVLLDCCHSALMARDPSAVDKAVPASTWVDIAAHNARIGPYLLQRGLEARDDGYDRAVVLAACGQREVTKEIDSDNRQVGWFTLVLTALLDELEAVQITWAGLAALLGPRIRFQFSEQHPQVDGPVDQILFTTTRAEATDILKATRRRQFVALDGGTLAGVGVGDRYAAVAPGDTDLARRAGLLTVRSVTSVDARADLVLEPGVVAMPNPADAHPVSRSARRSPVEVGEGAELDAVRAALAGSLHVEPVAPQLGGGLARVTSEAGGYVLGDAVGAIVGPIAADAGGVATVVRNLDQLARAAAARTLDPGTAAIRAGLDVTWGRAVDGQRESRDATGATLFVEDRIFVALRNTLLEPLYVYVFSIDGGGGIARLAGESTTGIALAPDQERVVGKRDDQDDVRGLRLVWPDHVRAEWPRPESLLVIASTESVDLRMLAQEGVQVTLRAGATSLEEELWQLVRGGDRAVREPDGTTAVWHIDYLLVPTRRPGHEEVAFLLDERPDVSVRLLASRPGGNTVAAELRVDEVRVRPPHPLHGPDVRLDVLVVTAPAVAGGPPEHTATTLRASAPAVGDDVLLADQLVAKGPARDVLDVVMWLSRDPDGGTPLADALVPPPAVGDQPPMASAAAGLEAIRALVDAADTAVRAAAHDVVAIYRGSFAVDAMSGPHPVGGLGAQQDIALRYTISAV